MSKIEWLAKIAGWCFALFLMIGLPLWIYMDGVGAGCMNDPVYDPHCHPAIHPHDWIAAVFAGGIWWIGAIVGVISWVRKRVRDAKLARMNARGHAINRALNTPSYPTLEEVLKRRGEV